MPDTDREILRHSFRALACVLPFLLCLCAGVMAIVLDAPMRPRPVGITLIVGASGWFWLLMLSIKEIDYLQALKSVRRHWNAR